MILTTKQKSISAIILILPENKNYANITDIKSQILGVTPTEVLKNPVLIHAIYYYVLR